jgi:hypothetical protein
VSSQKGEAEVIHLRKKQRTFPAKGKFKNETTYHCALLDLSKTSGNDSQTAATQNSPVLLTPCVGILCMLLGTLRDYFCKLH